MTAGGPGGRDRTLALKSQKTLKKSFFFVKKIIFFRKKIKITPQKYFFVAYIFYIFRTREIPRSGSKAKDGEKEKKKRKREKEERKKILQ